MKLAISLLSMTPHRTTCRRYCAGIPDPRLIVLCHKANRGVGGAVKTAFTKALELDADIIVKIDGDGQMDPQLIPQFVLPIIADHADLTKGNGFAHLSFIRQMPLIRRLGNLALSFLAKMSPPAIGMCLIPAMAT